MQTRTQLVGKLQRLAEWVNQHYPARKAIVSGETVIFGIAWIDGKGNRGTTTFSVRSFDEARTALGY